MDAEPDGGPVEAFALALDIDSWEEAVDLAQRSVPNLRSIGWALVDVETIARRWAEWPSTEGWTQTWDDMTEQYRQPWREDARRLLGLEP